MSSGGSAGVSKPPVLNNSVDFQPYAQAWQDGRAAYRQRRLPKENPYDRYSEYHGELERYEAWLIGYWSAHERAVRY
jgi:hypothetical protein